VNLIPRDAVHVGSTGTLVVEASSAQLDTFPDKVGIARRDASQMPVQFDLDCFDQNDGEIAGARYSASVDGKLLQLLVIND
jgi:hypothetical protein